MVGRMHRRRSGRLVSVVLATLWVPYLIIHCPTCPAAATTLAHCGTAAETSHHDGDAHEQHAAHGHAAHAEHDAAHHGHHGERAPADSHEHAPGGDCCEFTTLTATLSASPSVGLGVPFVVAVVLPAPVATDTVEHAAVVTESARHGPGANAPPLFLLFESFLC